MTVGSIESVNLKLDMDISPKKVVNRKKSPTNKTHVSSSSITMWPHESNSVLSSSDICSSSSSPSNTTTSNNNMDHHKIKKSRKTIKYETHVFTCNDEPLVASKRKLIAKYDLLRVLHLPQTLASQVLGCSFSTLKRRFYESKEDLGIEKWPQFYQEVRHLPIFEYIYPMSLTFILNPVNRHKKTSYSDLTPPYISDSEVRNHMEYPN
ncbi:predicted protein [Naegleria gruberi]|uniref:Predicted protein n=1 Tax=Naegleria gruberi TaxID=5762 RepID=D2VTM8_NAEGR|nr:uncharacterized protein NAEGRDRAFT_52154 [Naegleria gruberi]EFC39888.1 predicted protein [Naegleria gruberi]|eukprot:XP_002672632.1 predicted protein [Naegleria gruberi strain NEG-M]